MDQRYNFEYFEAEFRKYLHALNVKPATVKNYLSDIRFYFSWLKAHFRVESASFMELPHLLSKASLLDFYEYLGTAEISRSSANRRISAVRSYIEFAVKQNWLAENTSHLLDDEALMQQKETILHDYLASIANGDQKTDLDRQKAIIKNLLVS